MATGLTGLVLVTDAHGGRGGVALYNRHFIKAFSEYPRLKEVFVLPRSITYSLEERPNNVVFRTESAGGKLRYLMHCLKAVFGKRVDLIVCGHLHLLPFAWLIAFMHRCPVIPLTYGLEAWTPTTHWTVNHLCRKLKAFFSIRKFTASKFRRWAGIDNATFYYLPNCIDEAQYGVAPKRSDLTERFGINGKKVVMTTGRMDTDAAEERKGFDEVLEALPALRLHVPEITYLIVGDGADKPRLEKKAEDLGVGDIVRFSGYVPESEKADYCRLADVFAMPGSNPIFDRYPFRFAFLEALACGVPVVGCLLEDPSECDDPDAQELIIQVDPNNRDDIVRGILDGLTRSGKGKNPAIQQYYYPVFRERLHQHLQEILSRRDL